jgi:hypothetical protein
MRCRLRVLSALVVGSLLMVFAGSANAAVPSGETIVLVQNADTFATLGWSASGTFADEGTWTVDRLVFGAPNTSLFGDVEATLIGANGTFRVSFHGGTTPVGSVAAAWRAYRGRARTKTYLAWELGRRPSMQPLTSYLHANRERPLPLTARL